MTRRLPVKSMVIGIGASAAAAAFRIWQRRWLATDAEARLLLPGDGLVSEPASQLTRAISIDAPVEEVWRWVIQIGADRGGFYSFDWAENLFGLDIHSASEIRPEWQDRDVGDLVFADRAGTGGWYVMEVRPNEALVLKMADVRKASDPQHGRPARRDEGLRFEFLWTFAVSERREGGTRLLVRERVAIDSLLTRVALAPILVVVSFVMTRKMLLGIKDRAEHGHGARERTRGPEDRPARYQPPAAVMN